MNDSQRRVLIKALEKTSLQETPEIALFHTNCPRVSKKNGMGRTENRGDWASDSCRKSYVHHFSNNGYKSFESSNFVRLNFHVFVRLTHESHSTGPRGFRPRAHQCMGVLLRHAVGLGAESPFHSDCGIHLPLAILPELSASETKKKLSRT